MPSHTLFIHGGVLCVKVGDLVKYKNGVENFSGIVTEVLNTQKVNVCFHDLTILASIKVSERVPRKHSTV